MLIILYLLIFVYLILEVLNIIYYYHIKNKVNKKTYYYGNRIEKSIIKKFLKGDIINFFEKYFISYPDNTVLNMKRITLISVIRLLLSFLFNKSLSQAKYNNLKIVFQIVYRLRDKLNVKFVSDNINKKKDTFLRFGKNSIKSLYKPVFITLLLILVRIYYEAVLKFNNFKSYYSSKTNIHYWYKKNSNCKKPIIFIHGFGIGIIPYLSYIINLSKETTVICPVLPNISNIYFHPLKWNICKNDFFPDLNLIYQEINDILELHQISKVNIVAHSFGTFILSGMMLNSDLRKKIEKKVYVDPVCFHSATHKVYKSVDIIKEPNFNTFLSNIARYVIYYIVYLDIYLKYATKRNLFSMDYLWGNYRYIDADSKIVLSERDSITPSDNIYNDMKKSAKHRRIIWLPEAYHGDFFMDNKWKTQLIEINNFIIK